MHLSRAAYRNPRTAASGVFSQGNDRQKLAGKRLMLLPEAAAQFEILVRFVTAQRRHHYRTRAVHLFSDGNFAPRVRPWISPSGGYHCGDSQTLY